MRLSQKFIAVFAVARSPGKRCGFASLINFDRTVASKALSRLAMQQTEFFLNAGDREAYASNLEFVRRHVPISERLRVRILQYAKRLIV